IRSQLLYPVELQTPLRAETGKSRKSRKGASNVGAELPRQYDATTSFRRCSGEIIGFDESYAGVRAVAADDGGVGAGGEGREDSSFVCIVRRQSSGNKFSRAGICEPTVVTPDNGAVGVVKL